MGFVRALPQIIAGLLGVGLSTTSHAAWETTPNVELSAFSDDNLRLLPDYLPIVNSAEAMSLDARLRAVYAGERSNFFVEPRVRADQYSGEENEDLNGTDTFLRARGDYNWTQASLDFVIDYDQQDIKDAEVTDAFPDDPDIEDPTDPDTGLLIIDEDRKRFALRPSLDVAISDRSSLVFASELLDVSYTGADFAGRVDFTDIEVSAGVLRRVDERNEVSARLLASEYEADANQNLTKTFGVEGTFDRALTRDWTFNLAAGVSRSDYQFVNTQQQFIENADASFTYAIGLRQRSALNTINIDLSRETSPNSSGFLTLRDQLRFYLSRAMTERLRGDIGVRGYVTSTLDDVVAEDDRDYLRLDLSLEWAMTQQLYLHGGYSFTKQQLSDEGADATSNVFYIGFAFRGLSQR